MSFKPKTNEEMVLFWPADTLWPRGTRQTMNKSRIDCRSSPMDRSVLHENTDIIASFLENTPFVWHCILLACGREEASPPIDWGHSTSCSHHFDPRIFLFCFFLLRNGAKVDPTRRARPIFYCFLGCFRVDAEVVAGDFKAPIFRLKAKSSRRWRSKDVPQQRPQDS